MFSFNIYAQEIDLYVAGQKIGLFNKAQRLGKLYFIGTVVF